jgi:hypothetical protein
VQSLSGMRLCIELVTSLDVCLFACYKFLFANHEFPVFKDSNILIDGLDCFGIFLFHVIFENWAEFACWLS